jgi:hypothetical protein
VRRFAILLPLVLAAAILPASGQEAARRPPTGAGILAEELRDGTADPGARRDLEVGSRFHRIHTRFMAMGCRNCHAGDRALEEVQFLRREANPRNNYYGSVDRAICLGCHRGPNSMATPFYAAPGR